MVLFLNTQKQNNMNLQFYLQNLWRWKCDLPEFNDSIGTHPSLSDLNISQYPPEFAECDKYAHNRMIMGSFRYGLIDRQDLKDYNPAKEAIKRIEKYLKDENLEHLVDANNMIKIAYFRGKKFLNQTMNPIDDGEHAQPSDVINKIFDYKHNTTKERKEKLFAFVVANKTQIYQSFRHGKHCASSPEMKELLEKARIEIGYSPKTWNGDIVSVLVNAYVSIVVEGKETL